MAAMRFRLRTLLIVMALMPPLIAILYFGPSVAVWSGRFTLNLKIVNETGKTIGHVEAAPVHHPQDDDALVAHPEMERWMWHPVQLDEHLVGEVTVRCSGRETWLGREVAYRHQPRMALKIDFTDGSQSLFAVDIPKWRGIRDLTVRIPD